MNKETEKAMEILKEGKENDVMTIKKEKNMAQVILSGDCGEIGHAIFATMHDPKANIASNLYLMVKMIVLNILSNPSPYGHDLLNSIFKVLEKMEKEGQKPSDKTSKLVPLIPNKQ